MVSIYRPWRDIPIRRTHTYILPPHTRLGFCLPLFDERELIPRSSARFPSRRALEAAASYHPCHWRHTHTYLARRQLQWLGRGGWGLDGTGLPRTLLTARGPGEETWGGGRELTWGESVEKKLKRASHAFLSVDDVSTLCAEALPFVPQSLVVTAGTGRRRRQRQQQQRKASGWTCYHGQVGSWNGVGD
jgi:hypothetical protein